MVTAKYPYGSLEDGRKIQVFLVLRGEAFRETFSVKRFTERSVVDSIGVTNEGR